MADATPNPTLNDWVKTVLFDRGYLPRIRGEAIKVYLAIIEACGGVPDRSVTMSLSLLMERTQLSCPTVIESLARLEELGLVVSTTRQRGKVKTYYVSDPPATKESSPARAGWTGTRGRVSTKSKDR
jgi:replication initiation and membrane attachment protein DnaB